MTPLQVLASLPPDKRDAVLNELSPEEIEAIAYSWKDFARPEQLAPPGDWDVWMYLGGRGSGKTRACAEAVRDIAEQGQIDRIALVAATAKDARDTMIEGDSGLLAVCPPSFRPTYEPGKSRLVWPNGVTAYTYSAETPRALRGPQFHFAWADEVAAWQYMEETWDMLMFGLRLGKRPRAIISTTPRPVPLVKRLLKDPKCVVTRGSTYSNQANLAPSFIKSVIKRYEGTRLGRQELLAEMLEDVAGAFWTRPIIDANRVSEPPELGRIVVAVDPSGGNSENSDMQGIVVAGTDIQGHGYILEDATDLLTPDGWGRKAVQVAQKWKADAIVVERNFGGDMVQHVIETAARALNTAVRVIMVTATRGKVRRAEPVAALYEQGRVHHVGQFARLEDELYGFSSAGYMGGCSPNAADSAIWSLTHLMLGEESVPEQITLDSEAKAWNVL